METKIPFTPQPKGTQSIPRTDLPPEEYTITRDGQVLRPNGKPLRIYDRGGGYLCVRVRGKRYVLHRIVALKYIPNPEHKPEVDHIDGNPKNNCVENLRWVTRQENEMNPITRAKLSAAISGRELSPEWREKVSLGLAGKTPSEDTKRKRSESLRKSFANRRVLKPQPVSRTDKDTGETIHFHSITDAAKATGISTTTIVGCLKGRQNSRKYIWKRESPTE